MANLGNSATPLQDPVNTIQALQVFNGGKPCGWLGQTPKGYWFHYSSNNRQQHWVSLLMPPSQNFYHQAELFPVFAQYADTLTTLAQLNGQQLGSLSFANPDNPMVTPPLRTPPKLIPGQSALIIKPKNTTRKPFADTVAHHANNWPIIQTLQRIKKQADPNNRLHALRWALEAELSDEYLLYPRPDMDSYRQKLYGFEALHCVLNLNPLQFNALTNKPVKFVQILHEVVRTYCKSFSAEIELLQHILPFIDKGLVQAYLVYQQQASTNGPGRTPAILGVDYLVCKKLV